MDFSVLFLSCVVCYVMTNTAHHTLTDSIHQQPESHDQNSESCAVKRDFRVNKHGGQVLLLRWNFGPAPVLVSSIVVCFTGHVV